MKQKLLLIFVMLLLGLPIAFSYNFNDGTSSGNISFRDINTTVKYVNITVTGVNFTSVTIEMTGFVNLTLNISYADRINLAFPIGSNTSKYFTTSPTVNTFELSQTKNLVDDAYLNSEDRWNFSFIDLVANDHNKHNIIFNKSELYYINRTDTENVRLIRTDFPVNRPIQEITSFQLKNYIGGGAFKDGVLWTCGDKDSDGSSTTLILRNHSETDFSESSNFTINLDTVGSCKSMIYDGTTFWIAGFGFLNDLIRLNPNNYSQIDYKTISLTANHVLYDGNDIIRYSTSSASGGSVKRYIKRGFPIGLTINIGNDSTVEYTNLVENTKNITIIDLNATAINDYMAINCIGLSICTIPIIFNSTAGEWAYSNLDFSYDTSINITFFDEVTGEKITALVNYNIIGDNFGENFSTIASSVKHNDLPFGDYRINYNSDKYTQRDFYISLTNGTTNFYDLYLLSTGNGTDVTFTVQDNSGNELTNATIRLKRYYISTNSYRTVAMSRTNEEGDSLIDVDFNDAYYEILITYKEFSLRTIGARIISITRILTLDLIPSPFDIPDAIAGVTTSLTFNNVTQTFSYVFTDLTGVSRKGTLEVYKSTATTSGLVCTSTDTTSSGTLLCVVNTTGIPGTYTAKGFININPKLLTNTLQIFTGVVRQFKAIWGSQGIFFTILIAGTLGGLGAVISPAVGIIMFLVGIAIASFLGMSIISMVFLAFLILAAAILIFKMKR